MATYEVTVSRSGSAVVTSWSPSPTGSGDPANKYQFASGDIIKFKKASTDSVSVGSSSGFLNSSPGSLSTTFISRTVQSTASNHTLTYSITYSDGGGGFGGGGFGGGT